MSGATSTDSTTTTQEWRWMNEPEPQPLPENWANYGVEPVEDVEEHWYAVAYKAGTQLQWTIDQRTGQPVDGPHDEDRRIAVVYVRADGERAVVRDYRAERHESGWRPVSREYRAVRAFPPDAGGAVGRANKQEYLDALEALHGINPAVDRATRGETA